MDATGMRLDSYKKKYGEFRLPSTVNLFLLSLYVSGSHVPIIRRIIVPIRHLVYVTLCRWPSGTHTIRSSTQSDINQMSYWYNNSPDDGHTVAPKHVENRNKHTWKTVRQAGYLQGSYQDARSTNQKFIKLFFFSYQNIIDPVTSIWHVKLQIKSSYNLCTAFKQSIGTQTYNRRKLY